MALVRNVAFPAVWKMLWLLWQTREGIDTREIKIYADGVAGVVLDVLADLHIGGVNRNLNSALLHSENRTNTIIAGSSYIALDLWDRLTLWSGAKHHPTEYNDINRLEDFFVPIVQKSVWQKIWGINGNHDMRMGEKISGQKLWILNDYTNELGFQQILKPIDIIGGKIRLHGMPCFNTQPELYGSRAIRELITDINSHTWANIVMVHNPDGVRRIEAMKKSLGLSIDVPTLFLCGHTHGLLGFQDVPRFGNTLSGYARKWIGMEKDTPYISGYYKAESGEPYGIFVSQGMGDQADIFRILSGGRERPIFRFVGRESEAEIILWK